MEKLLKELFLKVYELNKTTKHHLFLEYSGHVNSISVHYYQNGFAVENDAIYFETIYLNSDTAETEIQNLLDQLDILKKGDEKDV